MWLSLDGYAFLSYSLCACGLLPSLYHYYYLSVISRDTEVEQGFTLPCLIRSLLLKSKEFQLCCLSDCHSRAVEVTGGRGCGGLEQWSPRVEIILVALGRY